MKIYFKFACIYCGQHIECETRFCGRQMLCPTCAHRIVIPSEPPRTAPQLRSLVPHAWEPAVPTPSLETPTRYRHRDSPAPVWT